MTDAELPTPANRSTAPLGDWVGRVEHQVDTVTAAPLAGLAATLDRADAALPVPGDEVPPLGHWLYFLSRAPQPQIGADGHPQRGGFLPPVALPRRMWAGGRIVFERPLRVGDRVERTSTIAAVDEKAGRSGRLVFVTVRHEIRGPAGPAIVEEHDIVYRDALLPGAARIEPPTAAADAAYACTVVPDPVLLFRYSALTFNGHRIHYDRGYATGVEGYPGLVVHGPLIATLLVDLLRREQPAALLRRFDFRAAIPLFDTEPFELCGRPEADGHGVSLWARNRAGQLAMQARATLTTP